MCAVAFMDLLDGTIVNVALPVIRADLRFSVQSLQWVPSAYLLTYGGFLLLGGRLADLLGRRRLLVAGTSLFGISSLVCGLAGSEGVLIGGRLAQGVGAAMMTPAALSILTTSFHTRGDRVKALGAWGGMGAVSGASGVLFGGVLTSEVSWRWVFFVNLPMVAVILVASFRLIDGERPKAPPLRDFDTVGAGLITGGMLLLVYALVNAPNVGWGTARTLGELAGAVVLIVLFLFNEQRHSNPLVPLSLFKIKDLWEADVTQVLAWAAFYTMFFLVTLYMEEVLHYSAIRTGLLYLPLTAGIGLGAGVATKGIPKIGTRPLIATGALLGAAGVFLLSRVPLHGTYLPDILPGMMIMGAGLGLVMVGVQNAANGAGRQGRTRSVADHRVLPARGRAGAGDLRLPRHRPNQPPARDAHPAVGGAHAWLPARTARRQHRTRDRRADRTTSAQRAGRRHGPRRGRQPGPARPRGWRTRTRSTSFPSRPSRTPRVTGPRRGGHGCSGASQKHAARDPAPASQPPERAVGWLHRQQERSKPPAHTAPPQS